MINQVLNVIAERLTDFILQENETINPDSPPVVMGNIGLSNALGGNETYMQDKIVLSLVNLVEEVTMKNTSPYRSFSIQPEIENPPTFVNLFLLFTANFTNPQGAGSSSQVTYNNGITLLSTVIEFFQSQNVFTVKNSPTPETIQDPKLQDIRIVLDLYSLTFEQVNHLWGSLGGKQLPFIMYKARVLPLKKDNVSRRGALIQDVQSNTTHLINESS